MEHRKHTTMLHCDALFNLSSIGKWAFPVSGGSFWNSLPSHMNSAPLLTIFREHLKTFLFRLSYQYLVIWSDLLFAWFNRGLAIIFVIQATQKSRWWWWYINFQQNTFSAT